MKPLSVLLRASSFFIIVAVCAAVGDPPLNAAEKFRSEIAERMQALGKNGAAAVAGVDHWLFLLSELRFLSCESFWGPAAAKVSRSTKPDTADPLPAIIDFQRQLKAKGVDLLLVPVPPKAAIYPEKLLGNEELSGSETTAPLKRFYEELAANGVDVLDLSPIFTAQRSASEGALFCKTDTHWSGEGCVVAARAIAERVREKLGAPAASGAFSGTWNDAELEGDLVSLLPPDAQKPGREKLRLRQVSNVATGGAVEADPASPLLILGDSHTLVFHDFAAERSGLLDQVALELNAAPDLIGTRGSGATAVRISLYRKSIKDPTYLAKKKVVVWCFTSREFTESDQGWAKLPISK